MLPTIKVKRDGPRGFHIINKSDFDPQKHELFEDDPGAEGAKKATVAELKAALEAKRITIPEGAKKADLQALLDQAG